MAGRTIKITSGSNPRTIDVDAEPSHATAPGGTNTETGQTESVDEAVDRMAGTASNAGRQAQSTDHMNQY
jgi:hypothetical protein